jgi:hypothetical protein
MATLPSSRLLATLHTSDRTFHYRLTRDDVLWMARMAAHEGGNAADTLWTVTQRFVWFAKDRGTRWESLGELAQAFSQPINPKWARDGEFCRPGGRYAGSHYCTEAKLARRDKARGMTLEQLAEESPDVVAVTALWAQGLLPNPAGRATNFSARKEAESYIGRKSSAKILFTRGNTFIAEPEALKWPDDYVYMEAVTGAYANSTGVHLPSTRVALARGAVEGALGFWRLL